LFVVKQRYKNLPFYIFSISLDDFIENILISLINNIALFLFVSVLFIFVKHFRECK
jgi:hypothetical protein